MKTRLLLFALGPIAAVGLATTAWGFEVLEAKTEAQILARPDPAPPLLQLDFDARLIDDGFDDPTNADVVIGWERVGGIEPTPFKVLIPAGCLVGNPDYHVADFRGCGVQLTYDPDGRGPVVLSILNFDARLKTRRNGTARLAVEASFTDAGQEHAILGALGEALEIAIGAELATALTNSIDAVSGIEPQPFLPAKTEARILTRPDPAPPVLQLDFDARLIDDGFGDPTNADIAIGWERVGGIQPTPFNVLIPAGCLVGNPDYHVADFRGCGVQLTYDPDGRGPVVLSILNFDARLKTRRNGTARLAVETSFTGAGQEHAILGALGEALEIAIGAELATALTNSIDAVSGVEPQPF